MQGRCASSTYQQINRRRSTLEEKRRSSATVMSSIQYQESQFFPSQDTSQEVSS